VIDPVRDVGEPFLLSSHVNKVRKLFSTQTHRDRGARTGQLF
jgi:hypothetical protein